MRSVPGASDATLAATSPAAAWPKDDWRSAYGDPQLTALIGEAVAGAPSLAAARSRLAQAKDVAQQRGAALLPDLTASATVDYAKQSHNNGVPPEFVPHGYHAAPRVALDFSYELDFWGRNWRRRAPMPPKPASHWSPRSHPCTPNCAASSRSTIPTRRR